MKDRDIEMFEVRKVGRLDIIGQIEVNNILYDCGKNMAEKYDLHHWDNSHFKNLIIVFLCELKNSVYLVFEDKRPVATFQTMVVDDIYHFEKLAVSPKVSRKGIGSYCMSTIEKMAKNIGCRRVVMEVYSLSKHAIEFYSNKGYVISGETKTLKYSEIKMEKNI